MITVLCRKDGQRCNGVDEKRSVLPPFKKRPVCRMGETFEGNPNLVCSERYIEHRGV